MPELVDERPARVVVRGERLRLAAGAVEREHELGAQSLAQRVATDEGLELGHQIRVGLDLEVGRDPLLQHAEAEILEPVDLVLREVLELQVGERSTAPERERVSQEPLSSSGGSSIPRLAAQPLETAEVELLAVELEHVARRAACAASPARGACVAETTVFCNEVVAVRGGCSPQSWSTRRSVETASFACSSSIVSTARWFRPPSGTGRPPSSTSSGPRILNSSILPVVTGFTRRWKGPRRPAISEPLGPRE